MGWVVPQVVQFAGHWGIGGSWQDRHWQGTETGQWVEMMPGTVWFWCRFFHNSLIRFSIFTQYRILCPWQTSETARQATSALFKHGPVRWLSQSASIYQQTSVLLRIVRILWSVTMILTCIDYWLVTDWLFHLHSSSGWWFGTFFIFPNSWDDDPIWLSYFSGGLKPPIRIVIIVIIVIIIPLLSWTNDN